MTHTGSIRHKQKIPKANIVIGVVLISFAILSFIPFYYAIMASLSNPKLISEGEFLLWPRDFTLAAYKRILQNKRFIISFKNSVFKTVVGVALNLAMQASMAFALSRKYLVGRKFFMIFCIFSMMFNPGIIPTYLVVKDLGLVDSIWSLILPCCISTWNIILLRNFFEGIPDSLEESARIDGANDLHIFVRIILPLSKPSIATIGLFCAVTHWNSFMDAVIYINDETKSVLQVFLQNILVQLESAYMFGDPLLLTDVSSLSLRTASVVVVTIPIVIFYPFIQKYFVKGIMVGAVKG